MSKIEPDAQNPQAKKKRVKGLWNVRVEQQQEARDDFHYVWLYEDPRAQWRMRLYAVGALALILAVVFFPVWPYAMRLGVWYISMGCLGLLALFFAMAIFRLILFVLTMFVTPPGLWLYPNLFEDVGFFDSFRPVWGWQETAEDKKRAKTEKKTKKDSKKAKKAGVGGDGVVAAQENGGPVHVPQQQQQQQQQQGSVQTSGAQPHQHHHHPSQRAEFQTARVEEVEDDE